jgi:hypothetical protein
VTSQQLLLLLVFWCHLALIFFSCKHRLLTQFIYTFFSFFLFPIIELHALVMLVDI